MCYRIGQGYDVHKLKSEGPLIIGGVHIEHTKGIVGHSDGDILVHSIIDALLGAFNLGDIGQHFPNTKEWENISGANMLALTRKIILDSFPGHEIVNLDATVILEKPKLSKYISQMKSIIGTMLALDIKCISIKATTTDKLGVIGLEQGIAAQAICLVKLN